MSEKGLKAKAYFEEGYNCAQAVVAAFSDEIGIPVETAIRLISPFGGGMGRLREVCGAFSGMLAVLGACYGYTDPAASEEKHALYQDVQALAAKFAEKNGSIVCRELLGLRAGASDPKPAQRTPAYYHDRRCGDYVACAADLLADFMAQHPRKGER